MNNELNQEFPVEWEDDHFVTRREFFKFMTFASGGLAFGTAALAAYSSLPKHERHFDAAKICSVSDVKAGAALAFSYPRPADLCLLIRKLDGELVGFTRRCTHLSCPIEYESGQGTERLYCPCHNGAFSLEDGHVLKGPPPHPLPQIKLEVRGDEIWAVGIRSEKSA